MFDIHNTQTVADRLKALLYRFNATPQQRKANRAVFDTLHKFERAGWHAPAFQRALDTIGGFAVTYQDKRLTIDHAPKDETVDAIHALLNEYLELISFRDDPMFAPPQARYTIEEAARYLGISERSIKHHVHVSKKLESEVIHQVMFFTREQLDAFKALDIKAGRPPKEPQPSN